MNKLLTFFVGLLAFSVNAQSDKSISFAYDQTPSVTVDGRSLLNPWAGGLNATQFSTMHLNDDSREDLVVFDRTANKLNTFIAIDASTSGTGTAWKYAPEYETAFPALCCWVLLVDYDGDGRKDLFTSGSYSIRVFHNESEKGRLIFRLIADPPHDPGPDGPVPCSAKLN